MLYVVLGAIIVVVNTHQAIVGFTKIIEADSETERKFHTLFLTLNILAVFTGFMVPIIHFSH